MFRKWKELNSVDVNMHNPEAAMTWDSLNSATLTTPYVTSHTLICESRGTDCSFALQVKMRGVSGRNAVRVSALVFEIWGLQNGVPEGSRLLGCDSVATEKWFRHSWDWGKRWRSWLINSAISRKVAVSIPDDVIGIFHWHNPSGRTIALGSTQTLTEMSIRNISWG